MFSCNVDEILNVLPGVAFSDKAADRKAAPIRGFNTPPEHSEELVCATPFIIPGG
jgi:hypothetical protein